MIGLCIGAALVAASLTCVSLTLFWEVAMGAPLTFEQWMKDVDALLIYQVGLDSGSIEDWLWFDDFDSGLTPSEAVRDWAAENIICLILQ